MASTHRHPSADPSLPSYQKIVVRYPTADHDDYDDYVRGEHVLPSGRRRALQVLVGTMLLSIMYVSLFYQSSNAVSMSSSKENFVVPVSGSSTSWISKDWQVLMGRSKKDKSSKKKDKESKKEHKKEAKKEKQGEGKEG